MVTDRAYLKGARMGEGLARLHAEVARIEALFLAAGALPVEPEALQPADVLLDLYGEEIRARAFVAADDGAEMMLRPDFTVPIARLHMDGGAEPARYSYCGPVWRKQDAGSTRAREYLQAGFEVFQAGDPAATDAEVFALIARALAGAPVDFVTGDMGLTLAAIDALETSAARKAALRRHVWRPAKFQALLSRYGAEHAGLVAARAPLIAARAEGRLAELVAAAGPEIGLRGAADIAARVERLAGEAATAPLSGTQVALIEAVMAVEDTSGRALARYREIAREAPGMGPAVDRFAARLDALGAAGIDAAALPFSASFGRTALEYYDGFVFGAVARGRPDLPPIASGGRYDAMTRVLGRGRGIPAVGAIIRPEALVSLIGGCRVKLRLGVPSKGRLRDETVRWLGARGVALTMTGAERAYAGRIEGVGGMELVLLSAGEIPRELAAGRVHLGVTGQDVVREQVAGWESALTEVAEMGFGFADLVVAVPAFWVDVRDMADLDSVAAEFRARHGHRLRVATKYHHLVRGFFRAHGVADFQLVDSQGATEGTVANETAEAVADITSTGSTLRDNHLRILDDGLILRSQATLFVSHAAPWEARTRAALAEFGARIGVDDPFAAPRPPAVLGAGG